MLGNGKKEISGNTALYLLTRQIFKHILRNVNSDKVPYETEGVKKYEGSNLQSASGTTTSDGLRSPTISEERVENGG